jgi:hypothetical protein
MMTLRQALTYQTNLYLRKLLLLELSPLELWLVNFTAIFTNLMGKITYLTKRFENIYNFIYFFDIMPKSSVPNLMSCDAIAKRQCFESETVLNFYLRLKLL